MSLLIITQEQFDNATELLQQDNNGFFLEFSLSTDRTFESDSALSIIELAEKIKTVSKILGIEKEDLPIMTHDWEESDHEIATKKIYFLTHNVFSVDYIYEDLYTVKEYDPTENIAVVSELANPQNNKTINTLIRSNVKNYLITY